MRDADATKLAILKVAGGLFNKQGYKATSISDITRELGMTKGAIYRHFDSKSDLEKEALIYLSKGMFQTLSTSIKLSKDVKGKMTAVFDYFSAYGKQSPVRGGCPLLNAAVEADDTNERLLEVVKGIANRIQSSIERVLANGKQHGQLSESMDAKAYASLVFSLLEGAIMLTRVHRNGQHMDIAVDHLRREFERHLI